MEGNREKTIYRSDDDIANLEAWAWNAADRNESHYPTLTYEDGIRHTLDWILGKTENSPADDW